MNNPKYICHVVGEEVRPLGVGDVQAIRGARYVWFTCSACDTSQHTRSQADFNAKQPGVHVAWIDEPPPSRVWRSRWEGRAKA